MQEGTRYLIRFVPTWTLAVASVTAEIPEMLLYRSYTTERLAK